MWTRKWALMLLAATAFFVSGLAFAQQQMEGVRGADAVQGIFGVDAETLASAIQTARNSDSILSVVAGIVNMAALLAAVLLVLMTFISSILQTGEHGKVGGRYSMVWVPLRVAIAAGMLTPLSLGGYSVIQAMVLWVGMQGSGFADKAWERSNGYLTQRMALTAAVPPRFSADVASKLYQMEACALAVERSAEGEGSATSASTFGVAVPLQFEAEVASQGWGIFQESSVVLSRRLRYSGTDGLGGIEGLCGSIMLERKVSGGDGVLDAIERDVAEVSLSNQARSILALQTEARALARDRMEGTISAEHVRAALIALEGRYVLDMRRATQIANNVKFRAEAELRERQMATAVSNGWLVAGAYYMTFAAYDEKMNKQIGATPEFSGPRTSELPPAVLQDVAPHIAAAAQIVPRNEDAAAMYVHPDYEGDNQGLLAAAVSASPVGITLDPRKQMQQAYDIVSRKMAGFARDGYAWLTEAALDDGSSLVPRLVQWGHLILHIAAAALAFLIAASVVGSMATGVGGVLIFMSFGPMVAGLFVIGAMMAYVVPAIPLLIWIAAVAGWLMMLVQAVVAAPLWAAAHASPEGEGFAGQRAMNGYMLLISLLARPVLMVTGLLAGMLILDFVGGFVLKAFQIFSGASATPGASAPGIVGMLVWIFLTATILVVLARWTFSLIEAVPNSVLRFIGAGAESIGETNMAEQARTMAIAAWASTQGKLGGAMRSAKGVGGGGGAGGKTGGVSANSGS